ncbi:MAG: zinc-ribbon domain-containing protein [Ruminococcus sp.]|nr:zinc-ribbon domain-containing protein [Ruminococcus sp.]
MYCRNCGQEINDNAVICVHCGAATDNSFKNPAAPNQANDVMTGGLVALCILIPIAGLIVGCVRKSNGQVVSGGKCIKYSIIVWIISIIISSVIGGIGLANIL